MVSQSGASVRYKYTVVREVSQKEDKCEILVLSRERSESKGRQA